MKRLVAVMIVALMATGSAYAQRGKCYDTVTLNQAARHIIAVIIQQVFQ